jgi:hypothetical protein
MSVLFATIGRLTIGVLYYCTLPFEPAFLYGMWFSCSETVMTSV